MMQDRRNIPAQDSLSHLSVSMEFDKRGMSCLDIYGLRVLYVEGIKYMYLPTAAM